MLTPPRIWFAILCIASWLAETKGLAAAVEGRSYTLQLWQTEKGLPQNGITAMLQSRDGYLWLGTYGGLVRFDGVRFKVFDAGNTPGMHNSRVTALCEDRAGVLWIGHETGDLTRLREGRFEAVALKGEEKIIGIYETAPGKMRLLLKSGRVRRSEDGVVLEMDSRGDLVPATYGGTQDSRGGVWILHSGTIWTFRDDKMERVEFDHALTDRMVFGIGAARDGGVWVVNAEKVREWKDGKWTRDLGKMPARPQFATVLVETVNGAVALGTVDDGLFILREGAEPIHFGRDSGLPQDWIRSACEDHEGNLWIGAGSGGLVAIRPARAMALNPPDGWQGRNVLGVTASRDGSLWIGTEGSGVYHYADGKWAHFGQEEGFANAFVWSLAEDREGQLWAGSWGGGVSKFNREKNLFEPARGFEGIDSQAPAMLATADGAMWVGTGSGLVRAKDDKVETIAGPGKVNGADVRAIAQDKNGVIWFGMAGGGLGQFANGVVKQFQKKDGLSSDFVQCLLADEDETLWLGTADVGMMRLKNGHFKKVGIAQGLPSNVICHMADDGRGNIWIGTHGGIVRVGKSDLNKVAEGELSVAPCLTYGETDGLPTLQCSGGLQPAGCRTADGKLWFSVTKSLVEVDPARVWTNQIPPRVLIEELIVSDVNVPLREGRVKIPPGRQQFDFQYTALSFSAPDHVQFKYRLEGLEKEWVSAGTQRGKSYSYLPPGDYTFRVIACNNDGVWNTNGASFAFTVLPFFWQTWWFRSLAAAALIGAAGGAAAVVAKRKYRRRVELAERQRSIERERARIAQDIHDDIGASLTRITLLSQSPREEDLDQIYITARNLTRSLDEIVWAVNPRHDTLDSLATYLGKFAQDFLGSAGIRCRLDVPVSLPALPLTAETRHNVFLAFKEALNNAVKHAGATEVRVALALEPSKIVLTVEDNGKGFSQSTVDEGNGLGNMRKRLSDIGGAFKLNSAEGSGTLVKFEIPAAVRVVS